MIRPHSWTRVTPTFFVVAFFTFMFMLIRKIGLFILLVLFV